MANRKRNKQIIVRVTEEERELIELKMVQLPTAQLGAYMRKMAIDEYIILLDTPEIKKHTAELSAIGRNINIIAKRICQNTIYEQDIKDIKNLMDEIWKLERKLLSHFLNIKKWKRVWEYPKIKSNFRKWITTYCACYLVKNSRQENLILCQWISIGYACYYIVFNYLTERIG